MAAAVLKPPADCAILPLKRGKQHADKSTE